MIDRLLKSLFFWFIIVVVLFLMGGAWLIADNWGWLNYSAPDTESNSTTLRNVGLILGGVLALVFGVWRGLVAERQANSAQRQVETAQQSLLNERYQRGSQMLGSEILVVRMGGISDLRRLAEEHTERYHIQVMDQFCHFVRNPIRGREGIVTEYTGSEPIHRLREDVQAAVEAIGYRREEGIRFEQRNKYAPNLTGACLSHLDLEKANLSSAVLNRVDLTNAYLLSADMSGAKLASANLSGATLAFANLSGSILRYAILSSAKLPSSKLCKATLDHANLSDAVLHAADLSEATLYGTILTGADFSLRAQGPATGVTQFQLDVACADKDNPPVLNRVYDAETGRVLVWRGKAPDTSH